MITRFIGSASDLKNVTKLALVRSDSMLLEDDIKYYTPDYLGYEFITLINEEYINDKGIFRYKVEKPIIFNAVIMYSIDLKPLGFTMLTQEISTSEFKIEVLDINLAFAIDTTGNSYIEIDLSDSAISYQYHIANTPKMHKRLFNKRVDYAMTYDQVAEESTDKSKFSRNLMDSNLNDLLYRYSGSLSWSDQQVSSIKFSTEYFYEPMYENGVLIRDSMITSIGGTTCMISYDVITGDVYTTFPTEEVKHHNIPGIVLIGSNFITKFENGVLSLIKSEYLLSNDDIENWILNKFNYNPSAEDRIRFVQDPKDRSIMIYTIDKSLGLKPISKKLSDIVDRLKLSSSIKSIVEVVSASDGLFIYRTKSSDGILIRNTAPSQILIEDSNYLYKDEQNKDSQFTSYFKGIDDADFAESGIPIEYVFEDNNYFKIMYQPFEYIPKFDKIEVISNKAILLGSWDESISGLKWKLIEFEPEEKDGFKNKLNYTIKSYLLGSKNNWRKLDCISRQKCNPRDLNILMSINEGRAWRIEDNISAL